MGPGIRGRNRSGTTQIIPGDSLAKCLLPVPMTLCSVGLEGLVPKGGMLPQGHTTMIPLNWDLRPAAPPLWAPHASESIGKEGSYSAGWGDSSRLPRENWAATP